MSCDLTLWRSPDPRLLKLRVRRTITTGERGTLGPGTGSLMPFKAYFWDRDLGQGRRKLGSLVAMEMLCSLGLRAGP